jgi:hypothetical protein
VPPRNPEVSGGESQMEELFHPLHLYAERASFDSSSLRFGKS